MLALELVIDYYVCVMKEFLILSLFLASNFWSSCGSKQEAPVIQEEMDKITQNESNSNGMMQSNNQPVFQIISAAEGTWGYIVDVNGQKIMQTTIPGMPGKLGFKNKTDAEATATLVWRKLKAGEFPPVVTPHELDSMKVNR